MIIDRKYIESALTGFSEGAPPAKCEKLHVRSDQRGGLFRLYLEDGNTVVAKVYHIRNLKERLKSMTRLSNGWRGWCVHRLVYQSGISTPEPIAFFRSSIRNGTKEEVMIMEDIGASTSSLAILKGFLSEGDHNRLLSLEDQMIDITVRFLNMNILDIDHQPNNFIVDTSGRLLRVDFECAQRHLFKSFRKKEFVTMIARFITGHIHAVQPEVDRSLAFVNRLYQKLNVSSEYRLLIKDKVNENLAHQLAENGIDTKVTLPS